MTPEVARPIFSISLADFQDMARKAEKIGNKNDCRRISIIMNRGIRCAAKAGAP